MWRSEPDRPQADHDHERRTNGRRFCPCQERVYAPPGRRVSNAAALVGEPSREAQQDLGRSRRHSFRINAKGDQRNETEMRTDIDRICTVPVVMNHSRASGARNPAPQWSNSGTAHESVGRASQQHSSPARASVRSGARLAVISGGARHPAPPPHRPQIDPTASDSLLVQIGRIVKPSRIDRPRGRMQAGAYANLNTSMEIAVWVAPGQTKMKRCDEIWIVAGCHAHQRGLPPGHDERSPRLFQ